MTQANAINAGSTGIQKFDGVATFSGITVTNHDVLVGATSNGITSVGPGSAGQVLQSGGASADPAYSTATFPSTATGTGTLLRADGTNWVPTTATFPTTAGTNGNLLTSNGTNWTSAAPATSGDVVGPGSATDNALVRFDGTTGKLIQNGVITEDDTGNLAVTASVSGATLSTTLSNTSNTSSANALQQVTVAGTSAGDAFTTYTVSGTTNWSQGVDNSASDAYVLAASTALGTTNVMSASTAGEVNWPLQPAFLANNTVGDTNVTGDGTSYTIICNSAIYDQNSDYNTGTGTFTAPVTGRYQMSSVIHIANIASALFTTGFVTFGTSNRTIFNGVCNVSTLRRITDNDVTLECSMTLDFDAGDTCTIGTSINGSTKTLTVGTLTYFSGTLLC